MTTAYEKAHEWLRKHGLDGSEFGYLKLSDDLELLLKEHERDTRHACAEAVLLCEAILETPTGNDAILPDDAHAACMNVKII